MLNDSQCIALRDQLFAGRFQTGHKERMFRYLAVAPGDAGDIDATVHFAYAPAAWSRAGHNSTSQDAASMIEAMIAQTPFKDNHLELQFHDYLGCGWPVPWGITAKDSFNNFPTLVLLETADGKVSGVLMRDANCGDTQASLANAYTELHEVEDLIDELTALQPNESFMGCWYKDCNLEADSIEAAIAVTPETDTEQKHVLVYREMEWLAGLWNNPTKPHAYPMELSSVADFHGTRVSSAKRRSRSGLDAPRAKQTIPGNYDVLDRALALLPADGEKTTDYENIPAIKALCDWWNIHAPESMRPAALFRVYIWKPNRRTFVAGDPEEPALQADVLAEMPAYALFEREGRPTVALSFYRGRAHNKEDAQGTQTYYANGEEAFQIGLDLNQVDEAYYALKGLRALARHY